MRADSKNSRMYLTQAEADKLGLPSNQEQIDRYNRAVRERSRYQVTKRFTAGVLEGITIVDDSPVPFAVGQEYAECLGSGKYIVLACVEADPSKNRIEIYRGADGWMTRWTGPHADQVARLFGGSELPTGFTLYADRDEVVATIARLNPGVEVR